MLPWITSEVISTILVSRPWCCTLYGIYCFTIITLLWQISTVLQYYVAHIKLDKVYVFTVLQILCYCVT